MHVQRELVGAVVLTATILGLVGLVTAPAFAQTDDYGTGATFGTYCPQLFQTVVRGSSGNQVLELQKFLSDYYDISPATIQTGYFGRITQGYVIQFQKEQGLPSYGIVGSLTRAAIAKVCAHVSSTTGPTFSAFSTSSSSGVAPLTVTANQISATFFISQSSGTDSNDGSQSKPFKTIVAALAALRARHSAKADYIISFLDAVYQLSDAINIDATLLGDGSSLTLQGASGGTNLTFATTISSNSLMKDDALLPRSTAATSYSFGGMYGYVNSKPAINPATGASTCPVGQIAATFLGQYNVDYPATFCYGTSVVSEPYDFGGMYGYVEGKPAVNIMTGATTCPAGYTGILFYGKTNVDWPATFCYRPHVSGQSPDYKFGGMYGYVNGKPAPNPITGSASCPMGYSASQVVGALNVDWPAWYCYQKSTPSLAGHVYVVPTDQEPAGMIVDGAIAPRASYDLSSNTRNSDDTFTLQMPEGVSSAASPLVAVGKNQWRLFRCPVTSLNASSNLGGTYSTTIDSACLNSTKTLSGESYSFSHISSIEGSASFFSRHGQWAYITSPSPKVAIYLTQPASITIIPRGQPHFLSIRGTVAQPVQNVRIQNIQFSNGGFQDTHDYVTLQSGVNIQAGTNTNAIQNAAVKVEHAKNVSIEKSIFTHLVGAAVWIVSNSNSVEISGNKFIDIAGIGVGAGEWRSPYSEQQAISALKINDNSFINVGRIFLDSSAIFATYIKDSEIARNTISHAPYSGISLGWGWTYSPQIGLGNNTVHDNRISNVMESLNDGGGIYLNSRMNGTDVYGNTIGPMGETSTPLKGFPLYADDGNGGVTIHDNQIQNVDFSQLPDISLQSPIFGPNYKVTSSPCGYKACDVKQFGNTVK